MTACPWRPRATQLNKTDSFVDSGTLSALGQCGAAQAANSKESPPSLIRKSEGAKVHKRLLSTETRRLGLAIRIYSNASKGLYLRSLSALDDLYLCDGSIGRKNGGLHSPVVTYNQGLPG
jgi:hypothetical protein